jgi:hypothetical protein
MDDDDSSRDAYLEAIVERVLAPYRPLVSPETLEAMREMLVEWLTLDEVGKDLLERARPRAAPIETEKRRSGGRAESEDMEADAPTDVKTGERPAGRVAGPGTKAGGSHE